MHNETHFKNVSAHIAHDRELPEPFTTSDHDVRNFDSFMLHVERLLSSELVALATPEELGCALLLWCRAWKQVPGGSLPDDNRILAAFSGARERWSQIRDVALHGFIKCSDGRLYHRVLCEEVRRASDKKQEFTSKREADRDRLKRWRKERGATEKEWESIRQDVFTRDKYSCVQCGSPEDLHCDHVVPTANGGKSTLNNLVTLCRACHSRKTAYQSRREMLDEMRTKSVPNAQRQGQGQGLSSSLRSEEEKKESGLRPPKKEAPAKPSPTDVQSANGHDNGSRGTRLPPDWGPSEADCAFAAQCGIADIGAAADEFADYWHAVPGSRGVKLDWSATWRNRCRETGQRQRRVETPAERRHREGRETTIRVVAELDARDAALDLGDP